MLGGQALVTKEPKNFKPIKMVGLISDTHIPKRARRIPTKVFEIFKSVDYIIHAGDLVELTVVDDLEQIAPVLAVYGNTDGLEVMNTHPKLNLLKIFGWKIFVVHDQNIINGSKDMQEIVRKDFDVLVYGHTHNSNIKWEDKILYINPGSPTDPAPALSKPSVGLLKITEEHIIPQIIDL